MADEPACIPKTAYATYGSGVKLRLSKVLVTSSQVPGLANRGITRTDLSLKNI
jgi:hypothetical protein